MRIRSTFSSATFLFNISFLLILNGYLFGQAPKAPPAPTIDYLQLPPTLAAEVGELAKHRRYLDIGRKLGEEAKKLEHPFMVRAFTTFTIDFHSRHLTWTLFFAKNMQPGESIYAMRRNTETIVPNSSEQPIEDKMGAFLQQARQKFPNNLHIDFACAYFFHQGRRFLLKPSFTYTPKEVYDIYQRAYEQNIFTPESLLFIALNRLERNEQPDSVGQLLETAYQHNADEPNIQAAFLNHLLSKKAYKQALTVANLLFTSAVTPEQKMAGYAGAARCYFHLEKYDNTMTAVENGLKLVPNHALLWAIGLDTLRKTKRWDDYEKLIRAVLDRSPESPASFLDYLDYLRLRGVTEHDNTFIEGYAKQKGGNNLATITRHTNVGTYYLTILYDGPKAVKQFTKAKKISTKLKNAPPDMARVLDDFIEKAKTLKVPPKAN